MGTTGIRHGIGIMLLSVIETIFHYIVMPQTLCQKYECWRNYNRPNIVCVRCTGSLTGAGSAVVECLTRDRRAAGSSLTGFTALWSLSKTHLS